MTRLKTEILQAPEGTVVATRGEIGMSEVEKLAQDFKSVLDQRPKLVVLDLSGVTMIASAGMGAMIAFRRDMGKAGGKVRLAATPPLVLEALHRALFHKIFEICDTVDVALGRSKY